MGGRKSYPTRKYLGTSNEVSKGISNFKQAVKDKKTEEISTRTLEIFVNARKPLNYSSYSTKLFPEVLKNYFVWKKIDNLDLLKQEISKSWNFVKKKNNIVVSKDVDRIIIENAVKTVGGKK